MSRSAKVVFMLDVDNTLLDNDRFEADLSVYLENEFHDHDGARYWALYEAVRAERGYADYLATLQSYRMEVKDQPQWMMMSSFLLDYPFAERLYPDALNVINLLRSHGETVILSDGDAVFQPRKIQRSGLWDAVDGRVLIYLHKEQMMDDIRQRYPGHHHVMVDDKLSILEAMKKIWGTHLTTVFPRQGHYALDPDKTAGHAPADITIERLGDLMNSNLAALAVSAAQTNQEKP
ncbi:MAG: HAD family hydrolase [Pseudomonadota bacterium]